MSGWATKRHSAPTASLPSRGRLRVRHPARQSREPRVVPPRARARGRSAPPRCPRSQHVDREGSSSIAIKAATRTVQARLMTPRANRAAISAQQQPRHHAACRRPSPGPRGPSRQAPSRNPSGLRHLTRQAPLSGVNSYTRPPRARRRPATARRCARRARRRRGPAEPVEAVGGDPGGAPDEQVAGAEEQRPAQPRRRVICA